VAWTSDATGRWAQQWVGWDGFSRFWAQAVRWTIVERADVPVEVNVALEGDEARVTVDAVDEEGQFVNGLDAGVSLVGPDGEPVVVELAQVAPGRYEGAFTPQEEGAYLMRLTGSLAGEEAVALTTGWVMGYSPEYAALEGDPAYLAYLAELGGGVVLEEPTAAFARTLRGEGAARDLWPVLLGLAALLLPFDVGVRRLALGRRDWEKMRDWVLERLSRRRPAPVAEAPSPVSRLFEAKARSEARQAERRPAAGVDAAEAPSPPVEQPPAPPSRPVEPAEPPPVAGEGTLAGRLLRKKRERREDDGD
jgi:hypothetical protein